MGSVLKSSGPKNTSVFKWPFSPIIIVWVPYHGKKNTTTEGLPFAFVFSFCFAHQNFVGFHIPGANKKREGLPFSFCLRPPEFCGFHIAGQKQKQTKGLPFAFSTLVFFSPTIILCGSISQVQKKKREGLPFVCFLLFVFAHHNFVGFHIPGTTTQKTTEGRPPEFCGVPYPRCKQKTGRVFHLLVFSFFSPTIILWVPDPGKNKQTKGLPFAFVLFFFSPTIILRVPYPRCKQKTKTGGSSICGSLVFRPPEFCGFHIQGAKKRKSGGFR